VFASFIAGEKPIGTKGSDTGSSTEVQAANAVTSRQDEARSKKFIPFIFKSLYLIGV
jgi:hypothetical protein